MDDSTRAETTAPEAEALTGLPESVLADRVSDLAGMFLNGRLVGKLRDWAAQLALVDKGDTATVEVMLDQFKLLRNNLLDSLNAETRATAEPLWPACDSVTSMAHLAFIADQTSTWIEAFSESDAFLLSARIQTIGLRKMVFAGRRELEMFAIDAPGGMVEQTTPVMHAGGTGTYL